MADQVLLKNTFDPLLKKTYAEFVEFKKELDTNHTRRAVVLRAQESVPKGTWSQDQLDDLNTLLKAVSDLFNMVSELANRVRDD
jgi:hypothetical protein